MHRLPSKSTVYRFRVAALLLCSRCLLGLISISVLVYSFVLEDRKLTLVGMGLGAVTIVAILLQWMLAARTRCPLCLTPVLAKKGCSTHRNARTFMGSYRLRVALAILLRGSFKCPYCHEPTSVEARPKRPGYSRG